MYVRIPSSPDPRRGHSEEEGKGAPEKITENYNKRQVLLPQKTCCPPSTRCGFLICRQKAQPSGSRKLHAVSSSRPQTVAHSQESADDPKMYLPRAPSPQRVPPLFCGPPPSQTPPLLVHFHPHPVHLILLNPVKADLQPRGRPLHLVQPQQMPKASRTSPPFMSLQQPKDALDSGDSHPT